jgi:hypothetical protein
LTPQAVEFFWGDKPFDLESLNRTNRRSMIMTLEQRVEQLEGTCRRLRCLLTGMISLTVAFVLVGAAPNAVKEKMQLKQLDIVDADGNVRISLGPADEGYGLVVYDRNGDFQATLTDAPLGAVMQLRKDGGSIKLMAMQEGGGMTIRDQHGKPRALVIQQKGAPSIILKDQQGKTVFSAPQ